VSGVLYWISCAASTMSLSEAASSSDVLESHASTGLSRRARAFVNQVATCFSVIPHSWASCFLTSALGYGSCWFASNQACNFCNALNGSLTVRWARDLVTWFSLWWVGVSGIGGEPLQVGHFVGCPGLINADNSQAEHRKLGFDGPSFSSGSSTSCWKSAIMLKLLQLLQRLFSLGFVMAQSSHATHLRSGQTSCPWPTNTVLVRSVDVKTLSFVTTGEIRS